MWYYSIDGKQQGPIDDATLDNLSASGAVTPDHLRLERRHGRVGAAKPGASRQTNWSTVNRSLGRFMYDLWQGRRRGQPHRSPRQSRMRRMQTDGRTVAQGGRRVHSKTITAWRDGKKVVAFDKTALPARCYKCNHAASGAPMQRKLYWHHPAWYLLLILRFLPYLLVAFFIRKAGDAGCIPLRKAQNKSQILYHRRLGRRHLGCFHEHRRRHVSNALDADHWNLGIHRVDCC